MRSDSSPEVKQVEGYKGIWFTLGLVTEYGDKFSGGLGTYTAKHTPFAIFSPEVNKTFFVYGGTTGENERYLVCMIGAFDHVNNSLSKPTIVNEKGGVDDPHDNPCMSHPFGSFLSGPLPFYLRLRAFHAFYLLLASQTLSRTFA